MIGGRVLLKEPVKQRILQKKGGFRQGQCSYKCDALQMEKIKSASNKSRIKENRLDRTRSY
ncbi:hypothetical protein AKG37_09525 [Bacillus australimaris]|uniref:Uncharacterized protein n=1 Tax=Bacillus australimaris TaxID=1326968 RepID=A0ABR5MRB4_9BACI|nr:hypothetical protein AKG37_09525 [Bacillus australimaris]